MKAANSTGSTGIAVRGNGSAAFVVQKKVPVSVTLMDSLFGSDHAHILYP